MKENRGKIFEGVVVSSKMAKTLVVAVNRFLKHPQYGKFIKKTKRYKVHCEKGDYKTGDKVSIMECRPISKDKHFKVLN